MATDSEGLWGNGSGDSGRNDSFSDYGFYDGIHPFSGGYTRCENNIHIGVNSDAV